MPLNFKKSSRGGKDDDHPCAVVPLHRRPLPHSRTDRCYVGSYLTDITFLGKIINPGGRRTEEEKRRSMRHLASRRGTARRPPVKGLRGAYLRWGEDIAQTESQTDRQAERPIGNKKEVDWASAAERPRNWRRKRGAREGGQVSNSRAISSSPVVHALLSSD